MPSVCPHLTAVYNWHTTYWYKYIHTILILKLKLNTYARIPCLKGPLGSNHYYCKPCGVQWPFLHLI
jgi:hypothetical protein